MTFMCHAKFHARFNIFHYIFLYFIVPPSKSDNCKCQLSHHRKCALVYLLFQRRITFNSFVRFHWLRQLKNTFASQLNPVNVILD